MRTKKLILTVVFAFACLSVLHAGHDKPITYSQLPVAAQQFIKKYFPRHKIALAKMEREFLGRSYDVIFTSGDKVEFNRSGEWTEIDCKSAPVPAGIVPAPIVNYVRKNYQGAQIMEIGRKDNYYEVNLSNRLEIKFNKKFQVIEIDS